eukprot:COSAG02_NODE_206_length_29144_cov_12.855121_20_plen_97_part_00
MVILRWNVTGSSRQWANRQANMCTGSTCPSQTARGSGCRKVTFIYSRLAIRVHTFGSSTVEFISMTELFKILLAPSLKTKEGLLGTSGSFNRYHIA